MANVKTHLIPIIELRQVRTGSIRYANRDISTPTAAAELCREVIDEQIGDADRELFVVLALNAKNRPVAFYVVSTGSLTASLVHPREVYKVAIMRNANAIIVAHNHPSGDPTPSREDREVTQRLSNAGQLLGISLLDSIVIGADGRYVSFRDRGLLS